MNNTIFNYQAETAFKPYRIVAFGSASNTRTVALDATAALAGITTDIGSNIGARVDVVEDGPHFLKLGGAVSAGDFLTANVVGEESGLGVVCAEGHYICQAKESGVAGDIIKVNICRGKIAAST